MSRWLVIFDPTLVSTAGHSCNYDVSVARDARSQFQRIVVFADAAFTPAEAGDVDVRPIPQTALVRALRWVVARSRSRRDSGALPNASSPLLPDSVRRAWRDFRAAGLAESLAMALAGLGVHEGDEIHVLIQQADLYEVIAVQRFLALPASTLARGMTVHLVMRHEPEIMRAGQDDAAEFCDRLSALAGSPHPRCRFYTDSEPIALRFRALLGPAAIWQVLPVPVPAMVRDFRLRRAVRPRGFFRVAMMGSPRLERGFGVLPALLDRIPAEIAGRPVVVLVQLDRGERDPVVCSIRRRLLERSRRPSSPGPRLELLDGPLSDQDYFSQFASADVLLAPYLSRKYERSTSGVFVEAIHLGIPAVVMRGTWTASVVQTAASRGHRIGVIAEGVDAIAGCVAEVLGSLAVYEAGVAEFLACFDPSTERSIPSLLLGSSSVPPEAIGRARADHPDESR